MKFSGSSLKIKHNRGACHYMKIAFLILGAQRSGTSVTSHVLSEFDVSFGKVEHFLRDKHNPIFFELTWVNRYNDRLIEALGYRYTDFFLPIEADYQTAQVTDLAAELPTLIRREWCNEPFIGIKDPRFSLTFPIWEHALLDAGYTLKIIVVFRCPGGFLQSNQRLLKNWPGWDEARHLRFWLQLNLAGIYFARNYPIHFVSYDDLMQSPLAITQRLADCFGLDRQRVATAAAVVDSTYYHTQFTNVDDPAIASYYQRLCSHNISAEDYLNYRSSVLAEALV
jgi:hypothetical protein